MVDPIPEEGEIAAQRIVREHLGDRRRQTPRNRRLVISTN